MSARWRYGPRAALAYSSILFFVPLLVLFFLLRDGEWLSQTSLDVAQRVHHHLGPHLLDGMVSALRGTVMGTVLIALGESGLISVGYMLAVSHAPPCSAP